MSCSVTSRSSAVPVYGAWAVPIMVTSRHGIKQRKRPPVSISASRSRCGRRLVTPMAISLSIRRVTRFNAFEKWNKRRRESARLSTQGPDAFTTSFARTSTPSSLETTSRARTPTTRVSARINSVASTKFATTAPCSAAESTNDSVRRSELCIWASCQTTAPVRFRESSPGARLRHSARLNALPAGRCF